MRLLFRCDGSSQLGLGHLSRCLTLADRIAASGGKATFAMRALTPDLAPWVEQRGHGLVKVVDRPSNDDWALLPSGEASWLSSVARQLGVSWVVIDHYGAGPRYLSEVARGHRLAVIDDGQDRDLGAAALVVNPAAIGVVGSYGTLAARAQLTGAQYALIHPAMRRARQRRQPDRQAYPPARALLCMGGADTTGLGEQLAQALSRALPKLQVIAIRGPASGPGSQPTDTDGPTQWLGRQTPAQMAQQMASSDLAIATTSTIAWELACLGVPSMLFAVSRNQEHLATVLERRQLAWICRSLAGFEQGLERIVDRGIKGLELDLPRWQSLCDGLGPQRVYEKMRALE